MKRVLSMVALALATPAAAQTQAQMNTDAGRRYQRADAAMTAEWKRTQVFMKTRDAREPSRGGGFGYAAALLESQRAWLKFRDTQCTIEGGEFAGGSMAPMMIAGCRARLTSERSDQLRKLRWAR